jgi:hypothetical protein
MKTWAAITIGGAVLFCVQARDGITARRLVQSLKHRSEGAILTVRLLRANDTGVCGAEIIHR